MSTATATHDEAAYDHVPEDLGPGVARPRVLLVGTALAGAAIIVFFAGLIGLYLRVRHGVITGPAVDGEAPVWFADGQTLPLTPANVAMGTMLLSCVSMQWAVDSVKRDDRRGSFFALAMTVLFGGAVINATSFLYTQSGFALSGGTNDAGLLFYAVTGSHLALIVGALLFVVIMTVRTLGGEHGSHDREGIVAASLIWYLTTGIMLAVWYAVYVTK
ncbi:MAG TPA: cytochrome c oxidase subunit 3 [Iamia sp.]|nr:cytochrome c oxidase subunit 3 [Iamia sp.]